MTTARTTITIIEGSPAASQAMFEAMFPEGHTPKVDTRTPADLGWHPAPDAAERATWRRRAA